MSNPEGRRRELRAYAGLTFGIALVAYSTFAKARGWQGPSTWILLVLGVGSVIPAFKLLRSLPVDRVRPPIGPRVLAVLAPLVVVAVTLYVLRPNLEGVALHDRELAGMTIGLPDGDEAPNPQHTAAVMVTGAGGFDVAVGVIWQIGTFDDTNARAIADSGAAKVGAKATPLPDGELVVGGGMPHRSFHVDAEAGVMSITVFACGPRLFGVIVAGDDTVGLARRVLASVRCHPSAEDGNDHVPAIVELPAGWHRTASEPQQLSYENGDETLVLQSMEIIADAQLQGTMEAAARHLGPGARLGARHEVAGPDGTRPVWSGTMTDQGVSIAFQLAIWPCPERRIAFMMVHMGGEDERKGLALFEHVRCAQPDRR